MYVCVRDFHWGQEEKAMDIPTPFQTDQVGTHIFYVLLVLKIIKIKHLKRGGLFL